MALPIPSSGYLKKIYFNTSISKDNVVEVLSQLTYSSDGTYYICVSASNLDKNLIVLKNSSYYSIVYSNGAVPFVIFTTDPSWSSVDPNITDTGWNPKQFSNPLEFNDDVDITNSNGEDVGLQNELLTSFISVYEAPTLDEFLTDLADSIRYVKGTTDKINAQNYSSEIRGLKGGSGSSTPVDNGAIYEGKYRVRYFDTDGTVLKIEYVESGGKTTPPDAPSYDPDYLIFAEWNYDIENYIVEQPTDIGATYNTVNDITYMFCRFTTSTGVNPTLAISGATSIDWGDGVIDSNTSHTYANEGEYLIKIIGNITFSTGSAKSLLGHSNLNKALQKCYIKSGITSINSYAFNDCHSLTNISIPASVTSIRTYAFQKCCSLTNISIPASVTILGDAIFYYCYGLKNISIPASVTILGDAMFCYCYGLKNVTIPNSVTSIEKTAFYNCHSLTNILIPVGVTSIGISAFNLCYGVTNYFIDCDTLPTLSSNNAFNGINKSAIMWVKDSYIEELKVATNWSTYASYMKPRSWYPSLTDPNA